MIKVLNDWPGKILINDKNVNLTGDFKFTDDMTVKLLPVKNVSSDEAANVHNEVLIEVRQYMTKKSTASFDFMKKWNNDIPMPLYIMQGVILDESPGMYKMKLKAPTTFKTDDRCFNCGKPLTNPVSKYFGMGPECGRHGYVNPFNSEEELNQAVEQYKQEVLSKINWEGWVIKSAILKKTLI